MGNGEQRTEKPITESLLIADGTAGGAGQLYNGTIDSETLVIGNKQTSEQINTTVTPEG